MLTPEKLVEPLQLGHPQTFHQRVGKRHRKHPQAISLAQTPQFSLQPMRWAALLLAWAAAECEAQSTGFSKTHMEKRLRDGISIAMILLYTFFKDLHTGLLLRFIIFRTIMLSVCRS